MQKDDLVLVYLLMSVDGNVSAEEENQFDELLKQSGFLESKNTVIGKAKDILSSVETEKDGEKNTIQLLYDKYKSHGNTINGKPYHKELLWTMINMAMVDDDFSENEKKFIYCCSKDWEISASILGEMIEIAKTLYSLHSHLDFLKSTNRPYETIEPLVKELNANKAVLEENLKELISA